jgi:DNA helicase-2/ATP-dependent DNA helicase PcrA
MKPLDSDQLVAYGDIVNIAGPGAGKTTVLLARHFNMLAQGITPKDIMNLTFTASAAQEMQDRSGIVTDDKIFRTFHSFALDLMQREREHHLFPLCDTVIHVRGEQHQLFKDLLRLYPAITTYNSLKTKIEEWQGNNVSPNTAVEETYRTPSTDYFYAQAYNDYELKCRQQGWLDFHGLMVETVRLLETNDEVRLRNTKKFISVDECQDTDVVQFKLLKLIYGGNIFVVGDENQLIYEWRSAQSGNLTNFATNFPGAKTLYLGNNYRSTQAIVRFLKKILPVDNGLGSRMQSMREEGEPVTFTGYTDDYAEGEAVLKMANVDPANSAIIARTNRQLMTIQKMCLAKGIRSRILGRKNVWEHNEVKHLIDLAKKIPNDPRPAHQVLKGLMEEHHLIGKYRHTGGPNEKDPVENLNDIVRMSAKRGTVQEFLKFLNKLTYGAKSDRKPALSLTTVHQAKGREWKNVFVIGAKQGTMPHKDGELLEEARIFFVACSRAADSLNISWYNSPSQFLNDFKEEFDYAEDRQRSDVLQD